MCYSKKFDCHQRNYSTVEKETLALVLSLQHFEVYLSSTIAPIEVFTDHNPLVYILPKKNHNKWLLCWSLVLIEYQLKIHHVKGCDNVVADALSRSA